MPFPPPRVRPWKRRRPASTSTRARGMDRRSTRKRRRWFARETRPTSSWPPSLASPARSVSLPSPRARSRRSVSGKRRPTSRDSTAPLRGATPSPRSLLPDFPVQASLIQVGQAAGETFYFSTVWFREPDGAWRLGAIFTKPATIFAKGTNGVRRGGGDAAIRGPSSQRGASLQRGHRSRGAGGLDQARRGGGSPAPATAHHGGPASLRPSRSLGRGGRYVQGLLGGVRHLRRRSGADDPLRERRSGERHAFSEGLRRSPDALRASGVPRVPGGVPPRGARSAGTGRPVEGVAERSYPLEPGP